MPQLRTAPYGTAASEGSAGAMRSRSRARDARGRHVCSAEWSLVFARSLADPRLEALPSTARSFRQLANPLGSAFGGRPREHPKVLRPFLVRCGGRCLAPRLQSPGVHAGLRRRSKGSRYDVDARHERSDRSTCQRNLAGVELPDRRPGRCPCGSRPRGARRRDRGTLEVEALGSLGGRSPLGVLSGPGTKGRPSLLRGSSSPDPR